MPGAVASGVVYPSVILKLKDYYRLRNIGGTSAGAIAATGAAAAEYNRENGGFDLLKKMSDCLGEGRNLRNLFQPSNDTKPLMYLVDAIFPAYQASPKGDETQQMGNKPNAFQSVPQIIGRLLRSWLTKYPRFSGTVLLSAIISGVLFAFLPLAVLGLIGLFTSNFLIAKVILDILTLLFLIVGGWLGYQIGGVVDALIKLPANFYGICSGHDDTKQNVLTDWLSDQLNQVAGLKSNEPLTFWHLKNKQPQNGQDVSITLRMITSNLSQGQPYLLPTSLKGFLFKEDAMRKLFPDYIVDHLVKYALKVQDPIVPVDKLPHEYYFLPDEDDLPVVVAMRLSLSFPILLGAIPLYTIKPSAIKAIKQDSNQQLQESDVQLNWFSDGGICDNFPIEFFDIWLPTRPTFGIILTSMPTKKFVGAQGQPAFAEAPDQSGRKMFSKDFFSAPIPNDKSSIPEDIPDIYLPRADAPPNSQWQQLEGTWAFLSAILSTGLGWYRTLQTNLPSYRDRIVQIRLSDAEDGLHINMPQEVIERLVTRGGQAGDLLIPGSDSKNFNFAHHEWVRYRILMAKLEENFKEMRKTLQDPLLRQPLAQPIKDSPYPPPPSDADWLPDANKRLRELEALLAKWQSRRPDLFSKDEPQPQTALRVTPDV